MTQEEIIEDGNRSIDFFMTGKVQEFVFEYDKRWELLMPVVEKIESIYDDFHGYFGVHIYSNSCSIQGTKLRTDPENFHPAYMSDPNAILDTKIASTWYNIVEWIKWFNTQKK